MMPLFADFLASHFGLGFELVLSDLPWLEVPDALEGQTCSTWIILLLVLLLT